MIVQLPKPSTLHDRDAEWRALMSFVGHTDPGATLGLLYGRRRQGKTYLLAQLVQALGGFMFTGIQQSGIQNLRDLSRAYHEFVDRPGAEFADWRAAVDALLRLGEEREAPVPVVLDEFSYLLDSVEGLASVIQVALAPQSRAGRQGRTRLILCGSALTTMRNVLRGTAPLRGRASLEMQVNPFGFRNAAEFWGVSGDPDLAFRLHALVGGTPAYREMSGATPSSGRDFDRWVVSHLLDPASAMYHEGNVLLYQEPEITDPALYFAVLSAISRGARRRSEIAAALARPDSALTHPLGVLESLLLIRRDEDALRRQRPVYRIAEPVIRLHRLVISTNEALLALRQADRVWAASADTVNSKIYGPHLEDLAREWCLAHADAQSLGGLPTRAGPATLACREHRQGHELDVVAVRSTPGEPDRVLAIGEVTATTSPVGESELARLDHLRDLLPRDRVAEPPRLLLFARAGFTPALHATARSRPDVELIDLERLYHGE